MSLVPARAAAPALLTLFGLVALPAAMAEGSKAPKRPNFVFVFADDWGWGDLGCYGHPALRTPHLDRLAREGILFPLTSTHPMPYLKA